MCYIRNSRVDTPSANSTNSKVSVRNKHVLRIHKHNTPFQYSTYNTLNSFELVYLYENNKNKPQNLSIVLSSNKR